MEGLEVVAQIRASVSGYFATSRHARCSNASPQNKVALGVSVTTADVINLGRLWADRVTNGRYMFLLLGTSISHRSTGAYIVVAVVNSKL